MFGINESAVAEHFTAGRMTAVAVLVAIGLIVRFGPLVLERLKSLKKEAGFDVVSPVEEATAIARKLQDAMSACGYAKADIHDAVSAVFARALSKTKEAAK